MINLRHKILLGYFAENAKSFVWKGEAKHPFERTGADVSQSRKYPFWKGFASIFGAFTAKNYPFVKVKKHFALGIFAPQTAVKLGHKSAYCRHSHFENRLYHHGRQIMISCEHMKAIEYQSQLVRGRAPLGAEYRTNFAKILRQRQPLNIISKLEKYVDCLRLVNRVCIAITKQAKLGIAEQLGCRRAGPF